MKTDFNKHNFFKNTFCEFQEVSLTLIENSKSSYKSKSGSIYYFTNEGVFRVSNHWGRAANCRWKLQSTEKIKSQTKKCGFAKWSGFYANNDNEKLFYIDVNHLTQEVSFQHKCNPKYTNQVLRNANATAKRIQTVKEVLKTESWVKYLKYDTIAILRKDIIHQLIHSDTPFVKIKQQFLS